MAKLLDKLYNREIVGKLTLEEGDLVGQGDKLAVKISTSNITQLTDEQLNNLKVGDVVQKITGQQKHCYIVTYKQEKHGICLSYFACGYLETVSYDYTANHWVYNSTDVCEVQNVEDAPSGTIQDALGLNSNGELVKGSVSGGTKLYKHTIQISWVDSDTAKSLSLVYITNSNLQFSSSNFDIGELIYGKLISMFGSSAELPYQPFPNAPFIIIKTLIQEDVNNNVEWTYASYQITISNIQTLSDTITEL